jgi:hypothetical protein
LYWWKEGKTLERWIFSKIEYSMVNSWKQGFINILWADKQETHEGNKENGKVSNLVLEAVSTFELWGNHWICKMVVARKGSNLVCFLENMVSRVDIACLEPCSTTSLYPY